MCLVLSLVLYKLGVPKRFTRKVVHILVGFEWVFLYHFMGAGVHFLAVCLIFLALLAVAYKGRLMPMISSDDDNAPGTVYYAVAMSGVALVGCFVPEIMLPFGVGIYCTSIGDGAAGLVGQLITKHNPRVYGKKTLFGTLANLLFSFLSALVMSLIFDMGLGIPHCLAIALLSATLELIVGYGFDNIAITWAVTALAYSFMYVPQIYFYIVPILLTPMVIMLVTAKRALTTTGVLAALALDIVISASLGNAGFILLLSFLLGGVLLDKLKRKSRNFHHDESLKGDTRDHMQVFANAVVPALAAFLCLISRNYIFAVAAVASIAEALADTAASGIGAYSRRAFDPFRMKFCEQGLSGGMSLIGTLASLVGAAVISFAALLMGVVDISGALIALAAAFAGAVFDSLLGSLFQLKLRCTACGKITEKHTHCGEATVYHSGLKLIDNDVVNLLSSLFSAGLAITLCAVFM